jgi:hypothetical protein
MSSTIPLLAMSLLIGASMPQLVLAQDSTRVIEVAFTPDMTRERLVEIQEEVKPAGVDLTYGVIEYEGDSLRTLGIHVEVPEASGKAATVALSRSSSFGFRYHPDAAEGAVLRVGNLKAEVGPMPPMPPKFR